MGALIKERPVLIDGLLCQAKSGSLSSVSVYDNYNSMVKEKSETIDSAQSIWKKYSNALRTEKKRKITTKSIWLIKSEGHKNPYRL